MVAAGRAAKGARLRWEEEPKGLTVELPAVGFTVAVDAEEGATSAAPGASRGWRPGPQS